jgi:cobalt-zinc-cadmium efflux system outer membrane protein
VVQITVEQAVSEAIDRNLNLLAERFNLAVADAAVITAGLRPNPVVTASVMRPDQSLVDAGISPYEQVFRTDYVLERDGKRERRLDQAALARSVTALQLANTTRTLRLDVQSAFVDVQLAQRELALAEENLSAFNNVVQVNSERVRTGDLAAFDARRVAVRQRCSATGYQAPRGEEPPKQPDRSWPRWGCTASHGRPAKRVAVDRL